MTGSKAETIAEHMVSYVSEGSGAAAPRYLSAPWGLRPGTPLHLGVPYGVSYAIPYGIPSIMIYVSELRSNNVSYLLTP